MTPGLLAKRIESHLQLKLETSAIPEWMIHRKIWTSTIKSLLGDLGKDLGYDVSASGYPKADQGEFLYDMIWYTLDSNGFVLHQYMAMECENEIASPTCVDDDFQKLVQARADVRVWISTAIDPADIQRHIRNCEYQIRHFEGGQPGDQYVLLFFEWTTETHLLTTMSL